MSKLNMTYEKVYADDSGKHRQNVFITHNPTSISYKKLWSGVIDGFFVCLNSDILITSTEGNIRIVVALEDGKFEQYFISEMDGKVITIPSGTKYAIQNIDEGKSSFLVGSYSQSGLDFEYYSKTIFNWRKKQS